MKRHWFEIVRRAAKRYSWLFVEVRDGQQRVLAYSARDYRSRKKARKAVAALQRVVPGAEVFELCDRDRFTVPASNFRLVSGVLPLVVGESPIAYPSAVIRRREPKRRSSQAKMRERPEEAVSPAQPAVQQRAAETEPEPSATPAQERPSRRGRQRPAS